MKKARVFAYTVKLILFICWTILLLWKTLENTSCVHRHSFGSF